MHPIITIQDSRDKDLFSLVSIDSYFDTVSSVFVAGTCFMLAVFPSLRGDLAALTFAIEEVIAFSVRADTRCASSVAWSDVRFLPSLELYQSLAYSSKVQQALHPYSEAMV